MKGFHQPLYTSSMYGIYIVPDLVTIINYLD